jgi:hypothetical protein
VILCPTNSRSGDSLFPLNKVKKIAFHFAPAIEPWALDAARLYAKMALSKKFDHVVIFTDKDASLEKFNKVLSSYSDSILESGICFISVSAHGEHAMGLSTVEFASLGKLTSEILVGLLSKLTSKSKLLLVFEACRSDRFIEKKNGTNFFSLFNSKPQSQFSFPNLNLSATQETYIDQDGVWFDESIFIDNFNVKKFVSETTIHVVKLKTSSPVVAGDTDIIVFGCEGYIDAICDGVNQRGCLAWPFYEAMKPQASDMLNYESLLKKINNSRPNMTTKWTVTCHRAGKKSDDFYNSAPLT